MCAGASDRGLGGAGRQDLCRRWPSGLSRRQPVQGSAAANPDPLSPEWLQQQGDDTKRKLDEALAEVAHAKAFMKIMQVTTPLPRPAPPKAHTTI